MIHPDFAAKIYELLFEFGYITGDTDPTHIRIDVEGTTIDVSMEFQ